MPYQGNTIMTYHWYGCGPIYTVQMLAMSHNVKQCLQHQLSGSVKVDGTTSPSSGLFYASYDAFGVYYIPLTLILYSVA